jgi:hypothetical protein
MPIDGSVPMLALALGEVCAPIDASGEAEAGAWLPTVGRVDEAGDVLGLPAPEHAVTKAATTQVTVARRRNLTGIVSLKVGGSLSARRPMHVAPEGVCDW